MVTNLHICLFSFIFLVEFISKNLKIKIYNTIIFPVVLCGCETLSLTLWEEWRLREFEIRFLRRIFGPKKNENGEWRRFRNEKFYSLYRSPNIVRVIKSRKLRWADHVARMEEGRTFKILTGKSIGMIVRRWEGNIRLEHKETGVNTRN